jgi:hypothetical protein
MSRLSLFANEIQELFPAGVCVYLRDGAITLEARVLKTVAGAGAIAPSLLYGQMKAEE